MIFGWYGLGRMLIEGLRTDSLYFGPEEWGIRISQALAAMIFIAAAALLIYFQIKKPNKPFYHKESVVNNKNVKKGNK
jgi:phosphatidylglycerol:prolipoprotein diacylglycerol transferase